MLERTAVYVPAGGVNERPAYLPAEGVDERPVYLPACGRLVVHLS